MKVNFNWAGSRWSVELLDDGTLDTHIRLSNGAEARFSQEYASQFRKRDGSMTSWGLRQLALNVLNDEA